MKKLLLAMLLLVATLGIAQDGRTKINYVNSTSQTLQMLIDGHAACTGTVIPNGFCTEIVNPGTYLAQATNGTQTTAGKNITVAYGETGEYTVVETDSKNLMPNRGEAKYVTVSDLDYHNGFSVDAPVTLTQQPATTETTPTGHTYTQNKYLAELPNGDTYLADVVTYDFTLPTGNLDRATEAFGSGINGTILNTVVTTTSGLPSKMTSFSSKEPATGRELRFVLLIVAKANKAYMFVFGTYLDVTSTNLEETKRFFTSVRIQ
jgi:hypothetical protein